MSRQKRLIVTAVDAGERLDLYLAAALQLPRKRIKTALDGGSVFVDGRCERRAGRLLTAGETILVTVATSCPERVVPELRIVARGDGWLAIDKPAGLVAHPTVAGDVNALDLVRTLLRRDDVSAAPILLHRLDRDTSGLLLFALSAAANRHLFRAFSERTAEKTYYALCAGTAQREWRVENHLRPGVRGRTVAVQSGGQRAETSFRLLSAAGGVSLIEARPKTGRTHQIRVHLAGCGLPLLGDTLYGGPDKLQTEKTLLPLSRHLLHAGRLAFVDPDGAAIALEASLPPDFQTVMTAVGLEKNYR